MEVEITCDNCKKGKLKVIHKDRMVTIRKHNLGRNYDESKSQDIYLTKECPVCGAYKGKRKINHEERIKRLRDSGLPMIIRSNYD